MNETLAFLIMWLADLLVLGTALLAVTCLALIFLRHPAARMALARGTLLGLAMLCVLTSLPCWPRQPLREVFSARAAEEERNESLLALALAEAGAILPAPLMIDAPPAGNENVLAAAPSAAPLTFARLLKLLPLFWLGTAVSALAYIFLGAWCAFRLLRTAVKAPAWSQQELERLIAPQSRLPRLKTSERIATAVALLAWRPHILLAAKSVSEENKAAVRAALAHEWAHIRHGDLWLLALERLLLPVFCLHPLFWLLRRQIRIDQELLADAAAAGDAPVEYAEALVSWAKVENAAAPRGFGIAALSLWEHSSSLSRRVEMLLHPKPSASVSPLWRWMTPLSLLAAVLGLSLITLRPAAVAQDNAVVEIEVQPRPEKIKRAKKEKPKKSDAKRPAADRSPQPVEANELIQMDILVGQVEHSALENAESSLGDLIQAASEDHCRLEGNLIVADLSAEQFARLTTDLKKLNALEILSKPRMTTIDGRKASVQIGSQVPLTRLEKTPHGDPQRRVDFKTVGEMIVICPHQNDKDPSRLTLDIAATHVELDKHSELRTGDDTPRFITHQFKLEVEASFGKTLVVTEREPKRGSGRVHSILLAIRPQPLATSVPEPVPPVATKAFESWSGSPSDLARLRDENSALRKQVDDLRAKLIDLEVQIRWLRDAAAPGGKEKVSDEVFLRRVYLDLTGAVPTVDETRSFLNDQDKQKRDKLIDKLLEKRVYRDPGEAERWKEAFKVRTRPDSPLQAKPQPSDGEAEMLQIVRLKRVLADDAAKKLTAQFQLASEKLTIVAEERTNSLLLRGSPEAMQTAKELLTELDAEPVPPPESKTAEPKASADLMQELKKLDIRAAEATMQAAKASYERMRILRDQSEGSEIDLAEALYTLRHAEVSLEAAKSGKETVMLREREVREAKAALAVKVAKLAAAKATRGAERNVNALMREVEKRDLVVKQAEARLEAARGA